MAKRARRIAGLITVSLLAAVAVADPLHMTRPSPVAAASCSALLVSPRESWSAFLVRHQQDIRSASSNHDLPVTLVAAVVADHLKQQTRFRDFTDCAGSALGANLSLGPGQLRLSTAAALDGKSIAKLSNSGYRELRARLLKPEQNIHLTARELRSLLERPHRYPGITSAELLQEPQAIALAVSEYRMGRSKAPRESAKLGINAFGTLSLMQSDQLDFLAHRASRDLERANITEYLRYIHCDSGIFNQRACKEWLEDQADRLPAVSRNKAMHSAKSP